MATNTTTPTPDFDFNATCRFFKSSFARTLSLNNGSGNNMNTANNCRSLDLDVNQHFKRNNDNNNGFNVNQCSNVVATKTDNGLEVANKQQAKRTTTAKELATNMDIDAKNEVSRSLLADNNDSNVNAELQKNKVISTTKCGTKILQQQRQQQQLPVNFRQQVGETATFNKMFKNSTQQQSTEPPWQFYMQLDDIHENNATTTTTLSNFNRKSLWNRNINNHNNKQVCLPTRYSLFCYID